MNKYICVTSDDLAQQASSTRIKLENGEQGHQDQDRHDPQERQVLDNIENKLAGSPTIRALRDNKGVRIFYFILMLQFYLIMKEYSVLIVRLRKYINFFGF